MPETIQITFKEVSNSAGVELKTAAGSRRIMPRAGDKLLLSDGDSVYLPVGSVTVAAGDGKSIKLTAPASLSVGKKAPHTGMPRWKWLCGVIWYYGADKPFGKPYKDDGVNVAVGVRG